MAWLIVGPVVFLLGLGYTAVAYPNTVSYGRAPVLGPLLMIVGWSVFLFGLVHP